MEYKNSKIRDDLNFKIKGVFFIKVVLLWFSKVVYSSLSVNL